MPDYICQPRPGLCWRLFRLAMLMASFRLIYVTALPPSFFAGLPVSTIRQSSTFIRRSQNALYRHLHWPAEPRRKEMLAASIARMMNFASRRFAACRLSAVGDAHHAKSGVTSAKMTA